MTARKPNAKPQIDFFAIDGYSDLSNEEIQDILKGLPQGGMPTPMGSGQGVPSVARPTKQNVGESSPVAAPTSPLGSQMTQGAALG